MTQQLRPQEEVFISVDVETAGPIPYTYSLLSLGACVVGDRAQFFYSELQPINANEVPEAIAVSGLSPRDLANRGEAPETTMRRFSDWIAKISNGSRKPVFVGFNAAFDWSFVNWYFHTYVGENPFGFSPLDIKAYYMGLTGCRWDETTSSKLPPQFQPTEGTATHNTLDDARAQAETFAKLLAAVRSKVEN